MALDPTKIPKGQSVEVTPGRSANLKGVYFHEASGKTLIALSTPSADALVHQGFVYKGPAVKQRGTNDAAPASVVAPDKTKGKK